MFAFPLLFHRKNCPCSVVRYACSPRNALFTLDIGYWALVIGYSDVTEASLGNGNEDEHRTED